MTFDELVERIRRRLVHYESTHEADTVLAESAVYEAQDLWQAAQPADPGRSTQEENERFGVASHVLGWLHFFRAYALPEGPASFVELARALIFLAPLASEPRAIPEPLHSVLGPSADASSQATLASDLISPDIGLTTADPAPVQVAVFLLTAAVAATPEDHPYRRRWLANLALAYLARFGDSGALADLDQAIDVSEQALAATPEDDADRPGMLGNLGMVYRARFEHRGVLADLDQAITLQEQALAATPEGETAPPGLLVNLGMAYSARFDRGGVLADLDRAIKLVQQSLAATPGDDLHRPGLLATLAFVHRSRYRRSGALADLEQAITLGEQALAATSVDPQRPRWLENLSLAYLSRFERGGQLADVDHAIMLGEQALAAKSEDDPERPITLGSLSGAYERRYERRGMVDDLDRAIKLGESAVAGIPEDHPRRPGMLGHLGTAYQARFRRSGVLAELDRAIKLAEGAVAAFPEDHADRPDWLANLGMAYWERFQRGAVVADLEQAIELIHQTLAATPEDHPGRPDLLGHLGSAYRERFQRGGALADVDQAIRLGEQAVAATPEDHPDRPGWLGRLGNAYQQRFAHGGVLADLDHAVRLGEGAVAAIPEDHPERPHWLHILGLAHHHRYLRGGLADDLDRAIELGEDAVAATPEDHPLRPGRLGHLGSAYRERFARGAGLADADHAITLGEQALAATPEDHPDRPDWLGNLGAAYLVRYQRGRVQADLDQAITLGEQALAATPEDHPDRPGWLINLGYAHRARFAVDQRTIDGDTLRTLTQQVSMVTTAAPDKRVRAGRAVGSLALATNDYATAVELLDAAVALLPSVAPREAGWTDQEHRLGDHFGLVGEAIAAHCAVDDPAGAVEIAELGRGVLLASHLDSRTDLTDLDHEHPELAARFRHLRDQLDTAGPTPGDPPLDTARQVEDRKRWWAEHDHLLARIRRHPPFARFLLPPRLADLRPAAAGGAVVLVNAGQRRGDAIIVTDAADPVLVPLPGLTLADVNSHATALLDTTHDATQLVGIVRRQRVLPEILGWLWDTIVESVLDACPPSARIWWLPTGLLGLFPLHAAGHPDQPGALDRVVSSYTPTLRALAHTRARPRASTRRQLTVALEHTPGLPDLPGTVAEAAGLHASHPDTPPLTGHHATTSEVLAALPTATWAHFACHASADLAAPSLGGLRLHDDTLPIPDISRLQLTHAELAYLSACSTAHRGVRHADECIHLASAFQLAGFRHVIASLWPLSDHVATVAAHAFYRQIPENHAADHAATALHRVTHELRAQYPNRPDLWAALIHSGP